MEPKVTNGFLILGGLAGFFNENGRDAYDYFSIDLEMQTGAVSQEGQGRW